MYESKWLNLQLFAGDGTGDGAGAGGETGVTAADAGQQRLRDLGVPEAALERRAKRGNTLRYRGPETSGSRQVQEDPTQQAAAAEETPEEGAEQSQDPTGKMSWEEIMKDPEYNRQMQSVIQSRLRSAKSAEENLNKLMPALELLARSHGMDPANIDYETLSAKISDDNAFYEDRAAEQGVSVETAKRTDQESRAQQRQQRQMAQDLEQQKMANHFMNLERQAEQMKRVFPGFDLRQELQNPAFQRMTHPSVGLSVEDAYYAVHRKEIQAASMQAAAEQTARKLSNAVQAGSRRPAEGGVNGQAPSDSSFSYKNASPAERKAFKDFIRAEAAAGRKVYPKR